MNILHLKYAVEVAKTKSISKAAENLYMGQPNLSRAIKELEESLGIIIFERNTKGITVTPDGEEFLQYARRIISQVEEIEDLYKNSKTKKQRFSACVPRASYISYAFTEFASHIDSSEAAEIFYKETNSMRTIDNVLKEEYNLGIVRYQIVFEPYFERKFAEKNLVWQTITVFSYLHFKRGISDRYVGEQLDTYSRIMTHIEDKLKVAAKDRFGYNQSEALISLIRTPNNTFPVFWKSYGKNKIVPFPRD